MASPTASSSPSPTASASFTLTPSPGDYSSVDRRFNVLGPLPDLYEVSLTVGVGFLVTSSILVLLMQLGWAQLEAGISRSLNTQHIFMKNKLCTSICCICFWLLGFGLAFGEGPGANAVFGTAAFALVSIKRSYMFFTQFTYANIATTIWHGPVAGRVRFTAYIVMTMATSIFIYPLAAHWVWSPKGFLSQGMISQIGVIDYSGGGPVHVLGGSIGLIGAIIVGPRLDYKPNAPSKFALAHNKSLAASGAFLLWFGWVAFTTISSATVSKAYQAEVVGRVATNTMLAGSAAAVTSFLGRRMTSRDYDLIWLSNSIMAGLSAITAPCACVVPWAAVVIGAVAAGFHAGWSEALHYFRIDDPLDGSAVHLACGAWGLLAAGFFAEPTLLQQTVIMQPGDSLRDYGIVYGGGGTQLGVQLAGAVCICAWSILISGIIFWAMNRCARLRFSKETELGGVDLFKHGTSAYGPGVSPDGNAPSGTGGGNSGGAQGGSGGVTANKRQPQPAEEPTDVISGLAIGDSANFSVPYLLTAPGAGDPAGAALDAARGHTTAPGGGEDKAARASARQGQNAQRSPPEQLPARRSRPAPSSDGGRSGGSAQDFAFGRHDSFTALERRRSGRASSRPSSREGSVSKSQQQQKSRAGRRAKRALRVFTGMRWGRITPPTSLYEGSGGGSDADGEGGGYGEEDEEGDDEGEGEGEEVMHEAGDGGFSGASDVLDSASAAHSAAQRRAARRAYLHAVRSGALGAGRFTSGGGAPAVAYSSAPGAFPREAAAAPHYLSGLPMGWGPGADSRLPFGGAQLHNSAGGRLENEGPMAPWPHSLPAPPPAAPPFSTAPAASHDLSAGWPMQPPTTAGPPAFSPWQPPLPPLQRQHQQLHQQQQPHHLPYFQASPQLAQHQALLLQQRSLQGSMGGFGPLLPPGDGGAAASAGGAIDGLAQQLQLHGDTAGLGGPLVRFAEGPPPHPPEQGAAASSVADGTAGSRAQVAAGSAELSAAATLTQEGPRAAADSTTGSSAPQRQPLPAASTTSLPASSSAASQAHAQPPQGRAALATVAPSVSVVQAGRSLSAAQPDDSGRRASETSNLAAATWAQASSPAARSPQASALASGPQARHLHLQQQRPDQQHPAKQQHAPPLGWPQPHAGHSHAQPASAPGAGVGPAGWNGPPTGYWGSAGGGVDPAQAAHLQQLQQQQQHQRALQAQAAFQLQYQLQLDQQPARSQQPQQPQLSWMGEDGSPMVAVPAAWWQAQQQHQQQHHSQHPMQPSQQQQQQHQQQQQLLQQHQQQQAHLAQLQQAQQQPQHQQPPTAWQAPRQHWQPHQQQQQQPQQPPPHASLSSVPAPAVPPPAAAWMAPPFASVSRPSSVLAGSPVARPGSARSLPPQPAAGAQPRGVAVDVTAAEAAGAAPAPQTSSDADAPGAQPTTKPGQQGDPEPPAGEQLLAPPTARGLPSPPRLVA